MDPVERRIGGACVRAASPTRNKNAVNRTAIEPMMAELGITKARGEIAAEADLDQARVSELDAMLGPIQPAAAGDRAAERGAGRAVEIGVF